MREQLGRILGVLVALAALVLVLVSLGVIPAAEPGPLRSEKLDVRKTVDPMRKEPAAKVPVAVPEIDVWRMDVCPAPSAGARAYRVTLGTARDGVVVWCGGGYELFEPKLRGSAPTLERLARFPSKLELPGGVAADDFDGDGVLDLALAVAPAYGVLHRPGAGVYLVRGRSAGGYEPARPLVETPTVALASAVVDGVAAPELLVLTRGDLAAQRPGELWVFTQAPTLTRSLVLPVGLDPRDLAVVRPGPDTPPHALVVTGEPGGLVDLPLPKELLAGGAPAKLTANVRGAQAFVPVARGTLPWVRDPTDVRAIELGTELTVRPWAQGVNVGPGVALDADADGKLDVLAATPNGVAHLSEGTNDGDELVLGGEVIVRDVLTVRDATDRDRALLLVEHREATPSLSLVLVPPPPWGDDIRVTSRSGEVHDAATLAGVPLE